MNSYSFRALDRAGVVQKGSVEAMTEAEARDMIWARGLTPFSVAESRGRAWTGSGRGNGEAAPLTDRQVAAFARDMTTLLLAGVALDKALAITGSNAADVRVRTAVGRMAEEVMKGASFPSAFRLGSGCADADFLSILDVGDLGGDVGASLGHVADLLERRIENRERIGKALIYPATLVVMAIASLGVVVGFLLPAVLPIYADNGLPLPPVLSALDYVSRHLLQFTFAPAIGGAIVFLALRAAGRKSEFRLRIARARLALPIVGPISKLRDAANFMRTLATLLSAGVPLVQSYETAVASIANEHSRLLVKRGQKQIREGVRLSIVFEDSGALPPLASQLAAIGEESGALRDMLSRAATVFEKQELERTNSLTSALSPILTVAIAGLIAVVILSIMSAILSINELVLR